MEIVRIEGATHDLGAPKNWDAAKDGPCESLPVRVEHPADGGTVRFLSAWKPDATEIERLRAGAPLTLSIVGMHPPVWIDVAAVPEAATPRARVETAAIKDVLWCMHIVGPDEIHAAPDFWTALGWAGELNSHIAKQAVAERWIEDENYPIAQAIVVQWPGTAETHAESLREELAKRAAHEERRRTTPTREAGASASDAAKTPGPLWAAWPEDDCDSDPRIDPMAQKATEWFVGRWPVGADEPECRVLIGEGRAAEIVARRVAAKLTSILNTDAINAAALAAPSPVVPDEVRRLSEAASPRNADAGRDVPRIEHTLAVGSFERAAAEWVRTLPAPPPPAPQDAPVVEG